MILDEPLTQDQVIEQLRGLVVVAGIDSVKLSEAELIAAFQQVHGLTVDGIAGQQTKRVIERPRFCRVPDRLVLDASQKCRWDHTNWDGKQWKGEPRHCQLTYFVEAAAPGLTKQQTDDAFATAARMWESACAVRLTPVTDSAKANFYFEIQKVDGPSSTLAWQELPCGRDSPTTQLKGRYDTSEQWVVAITPPANRIDLVRVIAHEWGHGLGLDHSQEGQLLAPFYDMNIRSPQDGDRKEAELRYGPPIATVPPTTPDTPTPGGPPPGTMKVSAVWSDGTHYAGELKRIVGK